MTKTTNQSARAGVDDLFAIARKAAENRQPDRMIAALAESGMLDGLVRRLEAKWQQMPRMEIEECVSASVDGAYDAISRGRVVRNLGAWLWKAADNQADDRWRDDYSHRAPSDEGVEDVAAEMPLTDAVRLQQEALAQHRRDEAVRLARRLLPRIGEGQIVSVMELIINAVEQGIPDLSPADVGDALGISPDAARTLLSRGFNRLRREAQYEGIMFPQDLPGAEHSDDSPLMTINEDHRYE